MRLVLLLASLAFLFAIATSQDELLEVFIVGHSHCDPGWLLSFKDYYNQEVKEIFNSVINDLWSNENHKFNWAETSFFVLWWEEQSDEMRDRLRILIKRGQLEFLQGGWVQHDEACPTINAIIDQMTEGTQYMLKTLGIRPRIAWQIDPFGHSSLDPSVFGPMGFDALVINRIPFKTKASFKKRKFMEFMWRRGDDEIFTHVLHTHYASPKTFDFENPESPEIQAATVRDRANQLVNELKSRSRAYRSNHLMTTFGDDFKFMQADRQFRNIDQLIQHINSEKSYGVRMRYALVSEYFDAVRRSSVKFPVHSGGFIPYADNEQSWWSGYFTSRPKLKAALREAESALHTAEVLFSLARAKLVQSVDWQRAFGMMETSRRSVALVQHHDGVTGTAKVNVINDYINMLTSAVSDTLAVAKQSLEVLLARSSVAPHLMSRTMTLALDAKREGINQPIILYNSLPWKRQYIHMMTVATQNVAVVDASGNKIHSEILRVWSSPTTPSMEKFRLFFQVEFPPLGAVTVFVVRNEGTSVTPVSIYTGDQMRGGSTEGVKIKTLPSGDDKPIQVDNGHYKLSIARDGSIDGIKVKDGEWSKLQHGYHAYRSTDSGAYLFRPLGEAGPLPHNDPAAIRVTRGSLVHEISIVPSDQHYPHQTITIYSPYDGGDEESTELLRRYIQIEHDLDVDMNMEVVSRFTTDVKNAGKLYIDDGYDMAEHSTSNHVSSSYYPVTTSTAIQDTKASLAVLVSQACGASSRGPGSLELMLHRRAQKDDFRGLNEPLNDQDRANMIHYLIYGSVNEKDAVYPRLVQMLNRPVGVFLAEAMATPEGWAKEFYTDYSPMVKPFEPAMLLQTLKARDGVSEDVILRVANIGGCSVMNGCSDSRATIDMTNVEQVFRSPMIVSRVRERSLSLAYPSGLVTPSERGDGYGVDESVVVSVGGVVDSGGGTGGQNAEEEGVFISDAAMAKKQPEIPKHVDPVKQPDDVPADPLDVPSTIPTRRLLTDANDALKHGQVRTYLVSLKDMSTPIIPPVETGEKKEEKREEKKEETREEKKEEKKKEENRVEKREEKREQPSSTSDQLTDLMVNVIIGNILFVAVIVLIVLVLLSRRNSGKLDRNRNSKALGYHRSLEV